MSLVASARAAAIALALVCLGACGKNPVAPPPPPPPQSEPISITCPATVEATSDEGKPVQVTFGSPAVTGVSPVTATCTPASGGTFPEGTTVVSCSATDALSRTASCTFNVRVLGPPRLAYTRFLAFGDSITEGKISPAPMVLMASPTTAYPVGLETRLRARYRVQSPPPTVISDGIGGENVASPNAVSIGGVFRFPTALNYYRPDAVLIMEGTNDLLSGQAGADDAIAALRTMVATAKARNLGVCLATIPPQRPNGIRNRAAVAALIPAFNDRIRAMAASEEIVLVDVYNALKDNLQLYIGVDDLHPTVAGYDKMAETFYDAIRTAFERQPAAAPWDAR